MSSVPEKQFEVTKMNKLMEKIEKKQPVIGTFCHLGGTNVAECLSLSGLDCFVVDTEHGPFSEGETMEMIRAAKLHEGTVFVRPRDSSRAAVLHMLDIGADGLIVPDVRSVEEVRNLVEYCKYFPMGRRGFAFARCAGYGTDPRLKNVQGYFDSCNQDSWLVPQCETSESLEHIEEITAMEGVDGIFVGPYDLSVALGKPAVFQTEEFQGAVRRILKACKENGKIAMIYADNRQKAEEYFAQGFDVVIIGTDTGLLLQSCRSLLK